MKKLSIALLLFTGCASVPYSIEMVNVHDTIDVQRGEYAGCRMKLENIGTLMLNGHGTMSTYEHVCGNLDCPDRFMYSYQKLQCVPFEEVRLDRKAREHFREGSLR